MQFSTAQIFSSQLQSICNKKHLKNPQKNNEF